MSRRKGLWERIHLDPWLLAMLLVLMLSGLVVLYSASGQQLDTVIAQGVRFGVALAVMSLLAQLSPTTLMRWSLPAYAFGVLMLVAVELIGDMGMGAQRWLVMLTCINAAEGVCVCPKLVRSPA
jgi:rod shape determining protein RodA